MPSTAKPIIRHMPVVLEFDFSPVHKNEEHVLPGPQEHAYTGYTNKSGPPGETKIGVETGINSDFNSVTGEEVVREG